MTRKKPIGNFRGAAFEPDVNWNDPPVHVQGEIAARIEAMRLDRLMDSLTQGVGLAKRIMALRACGWNDRDISLEVGGGMTPACIKQLLATYGKQAAKECVH